MANFCKAVGDGLKYDWYAALIYSCSSTHLQIIVTYYRWWELGGRRAWPVVFIILPCCLQLFIIVQPPHHWRFHNPLHSRVKLHQTNTTIICRGMTQHKKIKYNNFYTKICEHIIDIQHSPANLFNLKLDTESSWAVFGNQKWWCGRNRNMPNSGAINGQHFAHCSWFIQTRLTCTKCAVDCLKSNQKIALRMLISVMAIQLCVAWWDSLKIVGGICVFEVLLGLNFSHQPSVGLRATKKDAQKKLIQYWEPPASFMAVSGLVYQLWRF